MQKRPNGWYLIIHLENIFTQDDQREGEIILFYRKKDSRDVFKKLPCIYHKRKLTLEVQCDLLNFENNYDFHLVVTSENTATYDLPFCPIENYGMLYKLMLNKS